MMTEDLKRTGGVTKGACDFGGGTILDEISAKGLVDALLGVAWFEEEPAAFA